jgi:arylsulfatase A-like enzyme
VGWFDFRKTASAILLLAAACRPSTDRAVEPTRPAVGIVSRLVDAKQRGGLVRVAANDVGAGLPGGEAAGAAARPPRSSVGPDSRYVLEASQPFVLKTAEPVHYDSDQVTLDLILPPVLGAAPRVWLQATLSMREQAKERQTFGEILKGERLSVRSPGVVVEPVASGGEMHAALHLAIPASLKGQPCLLYVIGRPLSGTGHAQIASGPLEIAPGARLQFSAGVEDPGWEAGWPAVTFRVFAETAGASKQIYERTLDPATREGDRRWFDEQIDLADLAGQSVELRFETESTGSEPFVESFPLWGNPTLVSPQAATSWPPGQRSVILLSLDTLRAQELGAYGYTRDTSPIIDRRLAAAGTMVRDVITPFPFTPPGHMSMLTGVEPCVHGVTDISAALAPGFTTVAERFREAGYATAAFTEDAYLVAGAGFDRGFDTYAENRAPESVTPGFAGETYAAAGAWLEAHAGEPLFLFVHTYQVHEPYAPPEKYHSLYPAYRRHLRQWLTGKVDENAENQANYDREIRYLDDVIGEFLDRIDRLGLWPRVLVVTTADHGEAFGEHFWTGHGFDLHDEALRVPLIFTAPGLIPAGKRVESPPVSLMDVTPTILDLVGLPPANLGFGRSMQKLLTGWGDEYAAEPIFGSATTPVESVRTQDYKYMVNRYRNLKFLYDLRRDPAELVERSTQEPARVAQAERLLAEHRATCEHARQAVAASAEQTLREINSPWFVNRVEIEQKLRSLGYMQ